MAKAMAFHVVATLVLSIAWSVSAQTLVESLVLTYKANPELAAARADLRATDESLAQAKKDWFRPTLEAKLSTQYENVSEVEFEGAAFTYSEKLESYGAEVEASLPLYRGGRTLNSIRAARSGIASQESQLTETEQSVLSSAATAYAQVVLYDRLLELSLAQEKAYEPYLTMVRSRFRSREGTITDVSQVEANLASVRAAVYNQQGGLRAARAQYAAVVTEPPHRLEPSPWVPLAVSSLAEALEEGLNRNPTIRAAEGTLDQAGFLVHVRKGALLPSIDFSALYLRNQDTYRFAALGYTDHLNNEASETQVELSVTVPIFNGGYNYSRIREARQNEESARGTLRRARLDVRRQIESAWYEREAQAGRVEQFKDAVASARTALEGKEHEYKNGTTTMTEVLLVRQNLFLAQQMEARARIDYFTRHVDLMTAIGVFTARSLRLPVELYDPDHYLEDVQDRWIGYGIE